MPLTRLRIWFCCFILLVSVVSMGFFGVHAQFDPTAIKGTQTFKRPGSVDRKTYLKRHIEQRMEEAGTSEAAADGRTSHEIYSDNFRQAHQERFQKESDIRGIPARQDRVLHRLQRKTQQERDRLDITPRTGGTRYDVRPIRDDARPQVGSTKEEPEETDAAEENTEEQVLDPCANFTRQRLTRCIMEQRKKAFEKGL